MWMMEGQSLNKKRGYGFRQTMFTWWFWPQRWVTLHHYLLVRSIVCSTSTARLQLCGTTAMSRTDGSPNQGTISNLLSDNDKFVPSDFIQSSFHLLPICTIPVNAGAALGHSGARSVVCIIMRPTNIPPYHPWLLVCHSRPVLMMIFHTTHQLHHLPANIEPITNNYGWLMRIAPNFPHTVSPCITSLLCIILPTSYGASRGARRALVCNLPYPFHHGSQVVE